MCLGWPDPASHLRGTYDSEEGFREIVTAAGGLLPLVRPLALSVGGVPATRPEVGCIGILGSPRSVSRQYGVIFDGSRWLLRNYDGWTPLAGRPLGAWKVARCLG
jgi:hypothetical protein